MGNNGIHLVTIGDGAFQFLILLDDDTLNVENYLPPVAPTGYGTATVPYILMLMVGLALVLTLMRRCKGGGEDA